jgi:malate dehydrogenase (oxaloacetate-decarboxylating)(NADP+)
MVRKSDLDEGALYPPLRDIRKISLAIATNVATRAYDTGLARQKRPPDVRQTLDRMMYRP